MRVGEVEQLTWGDVNEPRGRWRVSQAVSKTRRGRWVNVPPEVFGAVLELCPRDDRSPDRPVFEGFSVDRFRMAISRACVAAFQCSHPTICAIVASRSCTSQGSRGPGSASMSASVTSP
jgi:integrase